MLYQEKSGNPAPHAFPGVKRVTNVAEFFNTLAGFDFTTHSSQIAEVTTLDHATKAKMLSAIDRCCC
jgi:hypothetical protein